MTFINITKVFYGLFFSQELRSFSQEKYLSSFVFQSSSLFNKTKYVEENMQETWSSFTMLEKTRH